MKKMKETRPIVLFCSRKYLAALKEGRQQEIIHGAVLIINKLTCSLLNLV